MSKDSDLAEFGREMRERRKERHADWKAQNLGFLIPELDKLGIPYVLRDEAVLVRDGLAKADFYPSTGRWRDLKGDGPKRGYCTSDGGTFSGGAREFVRWLLAVKEVR